MGNSKIKELIQKCFEEILQEDGGGNVSSNVGGFLSKFAFKKPSKIESLEEKMGILSPKAFRPPHKKHETSKTGFEDIPNLDLHLTPMKFKIVDSKSKNKKPKQPKQEALNEVRYSQFKSQSKRTHNSLFKINEKIQEINNKIKGLTE